MIRPPFRPGAIGVALLVAAAAVVVGFSARGRELESLFAKTSVGERALGSPKLRAALVREGVLHPRSGTTAGGADGNGCPEIELASGPLIPAEAPSTLVAPDPASDRSRPFVSLYLDPCRSARLHANPWAYGRGAEETGWVSIWDRGELLVATAAGVRIHGGVSRKDPPYSYRLYFRDRHGRRGVPARLVDEEQSGTIARLILAELDDLDSDGTPWPFPGELAADIGERLGAVVAESRVVRFSLNGETPRPMAAIEQIAPDFLSRRFGHDRFDIVRGKREVRDETEAVEAAEIAWIDGHPAPLLAGDAADRFDLESLIDWFVTVSFCGSGDLYQEAMVRDRTGVTRGGRWFWIHWDHDMSFRTPPHNSRFGRFQDTIYAILWSQRPTDHAPSRSLLLRLLSEDPAFRERVRARFQRALEVELGPAFLEDRISFHEREAAALGITDLHFANRLRELFASRHAEVDRQVAEALDALANPNLKRPPGLGRPRPGLSAGGRRRAAR